MKLAALIALLAITIVSADETTPVDDVRAKFYNIEMELWRKVTDPLWTEAGLSGDVELTKAFAAFDDRIKPLPAVPRPSLKTWLWKQVTENMQLIDGQYNHFIEFVRRQSAPGAVSALAREWVDLTETVLLDPRTSVSHSVNKLHKLLDQGEIVLYQDVLQEDGSNVCTLQMSTHQLMYDIYNTIALTEIKGYAMMQFSWMLLRIYGKGNYTQEASLTRQRYAKRASQSAEMVSNALDLADRNVYECDPLQHIEGTTYDQVTRLLQGYIENEVDMNADGTCKENCAHYTLANNHGCFKEQFCAKQQTCMGRIIDCQYIDSDMDVCPASSRASKRRYEWIRYENGRSLGKDNDNCMRGTTKVDSWWKWNLFHCSYCFCLCEEEVNSSERFFSTKEALADINKNKVVTGIRLVKHGRVFHLQIHQGTLKERGYVEAGEWVPVQKFDPLDGEYKDGVDYHTLSYEKRAIDLDELDSPEGSVLTGVRFSVIGAHLHFEIRSTPFNYTTGRLTPQKSQWISNDNTEGSMQPRSKLELYKPDIPTASHTPLSVDSEHDQYIEFTHTDFDSDAAQSTVPFIDVQKVLPGKGASLISGAGIIHRGARGSGGFIGVKLITYPYGRHVKAEPPPPEFIEEEEGTRDFIPVVN